MGTIVGFEGMQARLCIRIGPVLLGLWMSLVGLRADVWSEVRGRGVIRWGNDAEGGAPYVFHAAEDASRLVGFEVEFAGALAARLGLKDEFVQNNWDMLLPGLRPGGSFDVVIAGIERSSENLARVDLSRPYFVYGQQWVVRADDAAHGSPEALRGCRVGVLSGTASFRWLQAQGGFEVRIYQDNVNYFRDLEVGRLDAVLADTPIVQENLKGNPRLRRVGLPFGWGHYAVAVPRGEQALLTRVDEAILALAKDGILQRIYERYGLWDETQQALVSWKPQEMGERQRRSVMAEWRGVLPALLRAAVTTVWVTLGGMSLAVVWGLVLALMRLYGPGWMRWMSVGYVEVFRGTPLLLQIYFIYYGLAQQLGWKLSAGVAAVLALGLNYAAAEAENYRAGIQAVPAGQMEAALAWGMRRRVALRRVLLPQALRIALPSVTNDFIAMFKDSSIVSVIALVELTKEFQIRAMDTGDYLGLGLLTAGLYLAMSWTASALARGLEKRLRHDLR